jgi:hypothetical protein
LGGLSRAQVALTVVASTGILAVGFLAGIGIGNGGGSPSPEGQSPARITTRDSSLDVPTLGEAKQIPRLEVKEQPVTSTSEEGTDSTFTPSASAGESGSGEVKTPAGTGPAEPEPEPEVTVAPNG